MMTTVLIPLLTSEAKVRSQPVAVLPSVLGVHALDGGVVHLREVLEHQRACEEACWADEDILEVVRP